MTDSITVNSNILKASSFNKKLRYHASCTSDDSLYIVGGDDMQTLDVNTDLIVLKKLSKLAMYPMENAVHYAVRGGAVAEFEGKLYFFGGVSDNEDFAPEIRSALIDRQNNVRWNIEDNLKGTWEVPQPWRQGHTWTRVGDKYYVFGGENNKNRLHAGIWQFDPVQESWSYIHPRGNSPQCIPIPRYYHLACSYKDELLILGGLGIEFPEKDAYIYRFHTIKKEWQDPIPLPSGMYKKGVCEGAMVAVGSILVIVGGKETAAVMDFFPEEVREHVCEEIVLYDIENDKWERSVNVNGVLGQRSGHTMHQIGNACFVVGGDSQNLSEGDVVCLTCDFFNSSEKSINGIPFLAPSKIPREPFPPPTGPFDSNIITFQDGFKLNEWYGVKHQKWKLLYRGTRDGFQASNWHSKVDHKGPTMTIIRSSNGYIFGGFTPIPWKSSGADQFDDKTWIYSLKNPHDSNKYKFPKISYHGQRSVYHAAGYAFWVGNNDIIIYSNANTTTSSNCNLGKAFSYALNYPATTFFCGQTNFTVNEIETFGLA